MAEEQELNVMWGLNCIDGTPLDNVEFEPDTSVPILREAKLAQYHRQLAEIKTMVAHFHDELTDSVVDSVEDDPEHVVRMYARIWLKNVYDNIGLAKGALEGLDKHLRMEKTNLTALAESNKNPE